jgi:predicted lipid-binding transport protein (Tim44 family)
MSDGGKGSAPRPFSVSQEEFANNFDAIFKKNIKAAEEIHSDKGYKLGTKEGYDEFAKKRQEAALDEMVRISQEMGLYDDEFDEIHKYNEETKEVKFRQLNK